MFFNKDNTTTQKDIGINTETITLEFRHGTAISKLYKRTNKVRSHKNTKKCQTNIGKNDQNYEIKTKYCKSHSSYQLNDETIKKINSSPDNP